MPQTTVTVCEDIPPYEFVEFLEWVEDIKREIPEEFWGSAKVSIGSGMSYDQDYPTCHVTYERPETEEELRQRKAEERMKNTRRVASERAQYEALKAKFDPDPPATTAGISLKKP